MNGNWLEALYNGVLSPANMHTFPAGFSPFGRITDLVARRISVSSLESFTAFSGTLIQSCHSWMEATASCLPVFFSTLLVHTHAQPHSAPNAFLHEWRISYWDYVSSCWMNYSDFGIKWWCTASLAKSADSNAATKLLQWSFNGWKQMKSNWLCTEALSKELIHHIFLQVEERIPILLQLAYPKWAIVMQKN